MKSACGSGASGDLTYTCPDMAPFTDANGQTILGFTAISGNLHSEADTECACYETTLKARGLPEDVHRWTSKNIIYQVTSVGGLDKADDIDLLTPTAGMGENMLGCPTQYPGAAWLDTKNFGGMKAQSHNQCDSLVRNNVCMKKGCYFIADLPNNPWIERRARRVACPARLLAISQCQRKDDYKFPASNFASESCNKPPVGFNKAGFKFDFKNSKCQGALTAAAQAGQCAGI
ncbi:uncharacterized protein PSFLO_07056 [Pseudozyma flocculosa]|nr:uncharacterized protein PSFLO_07056 [Pseudozyma flocculosa]